MSRTTAARRHPHVYIASRTKHAERWRALREAGLSVTSGWIDRGTRGEVGDWDALWRSCIREVGVADALLLYAEPGEHLRGALVELGVALAAGIPVVYVGPDETLGTVLHAPGITRASSVESALDGLVTRRR